MSSSRSPGKSLVPRAIVLVVLLALSACQDQSVQRINVLWQQTLRPYLQDDLWRPEYNYDAANVLMGPLHFAFDSTRPDMQRDFHRFFQRFDARVGEEFDANPQREMQFSYLLSRYLYLSAGNGSWSALHERRYRGLLETLQYYWEKRPSPHWAYASDFKGVKRRVEWKLAPTRTNFRYFSAIIDEEYFIFAIASDLAAVAERRGAAVPEVVRDIGDVALRAFRLGGVFTTDGGWLMQPGVWSDHKDYRYAGHLELAEVLSEAPVAGIGMDSSHSHRMPLWLASLESGAGTPEAAAYYRHLRQAFRLQFDSKVLVPAGRAYAWPVLNNYMDGHNGIYRYGYETLEQGSGYPPYGLSSVLFHGWYGFGCSTELRHQLALLVDQFPLAPDIVSFYTATISSRPRHPLVADTALLHNGLGELLLRVQLALLDGPACRTERALPAAGGR